MKTKSKILIICASLFCFGMIFSFSQTSRVADAKENTNPMPSYVQGEVIVKFKPQASKPDKENILQKLGDKIKQQNAISSLTSSRHRDITVIQTISPEEPLADIIQQLESEPLVEYAEPNYLFYTSLVPNEYSDRDDLASSQWGVNQIQAPDVWDSQTGSEQTIIAAIDTGADWLHEDLAANIWTNPGEDAWSDPTDPTTGNGTDDDGNGYIDDWKGWDFVDTGEPDCTDLDCTTRDNNPDDDQGHGTHVSGIASAVTDNSIGVAGVCWNCKIMVVRAGYEYQDVYGVLDNIDSAAAIYYAVDNGADIINLSWGSYSDSSTIRTAIEYAEANGVIVVAAAGNDNVSIISYPAGYNSVIGVAATDSEDNRSLWLPYGSNYGSWVSLAAPGTSILSTVKNDGYQNWSGTSMATPIAAGAFGLVKSEHPSWSMSQLQTTVLNSCDDVGDSTLGAGRINAAEAVSYQLLNISTTTLPQGTQGTAYSKTLSAVGSGTRTWSIKTGSLPSGLSLNASTGKISGTPTTAGTSSFTVKVQTSSFVPESDTQALSLTIQPSSLTITTTSVPDGTANKSYSKTLAASGGTTPYAWSISSGSLPPGLLLGSSTGKISGIPTQIGEYSFTVKVKSSDSQQDTQNYTASISYATTHINGSLVKTAASKAVYLIQDQTKRLIPSAAVFYSHHYEWNQIATISKTELAVYPKGAKLALSEGTLVKSSTPAVYIINQNGSRSVFPRAEIFLARGYQWGQVLTATSTELSTYPTTDPVGSDATGKVVKTSSSPAVWLIESGQKRSFPSADTFIGLGYRWSDIKRISDATLDQYPTGSVVTLTHPAGTVVKKSSSAAIFLLERENNKTVKKLFPSADVYLASGYDWDDIVLVHSTELKKYSTQSEMDLRQGILVQGSTASVYAIDNNTKRPFASAADFLDLGYQWSGINRVYNITLKAVPTGTRM